MSDTGSQLDLLDQPPTRLQDVTVQDWDWKHYALARELHDKAPTCICILWLWRWRAEGRGYHRAVKRINFLMHEMEACK